jgi:WD40 repeat protein
VATGTELGPNGGHTGGIASLLFAEGGKTLFSGGIDFKVFEWDLADGRPRRQLFRKLPGRLEVNWPASNHALAADGTTLAWTGLIDPDRPPDRLIHLWDCSTGKELRRLDAQEDFTWSLVFSPNVKVLASNGRGGMRLWDVASGQEIRFLPQVRGFAFSPDGKLLAGTKNNFRTISLWQVDTGKELREWDSPFNGHSLVFSPNGKLLASSHDPPSLPRHVVCVWETGTGKQVARFEQPDFVDCLAFAPSGRTLAGAVRGRGQYMREKSRGVCSLCLWEVLSGEEIRQIQSPVVPCSLAFAPDSRTLAAGNADSTVLVWDLAGRAGDIKPQPRLSAKDLEGLWSDLAADAPRAQQAIWTLAFAPRQSMPLLKERLLATPVPLEKIAKLAADLDNGSFAIRQKAAEALEKMGGAAEFGVRKLLAGNPTLEVQRRLSQFLAKREKEPLRKLRAIEVLEHIGTPEARQVLEAVAVSAANPLVGEAAELASKRLASRTP